MNCRDLLQFCFDYLEGALPEGVSTKFKTHLDRCPDCVSFFETYRKTPTLSREALDTQMPSSVRESVRSFLKKRCCE